MEQEKELSVAEIPKFSSPALEFEVLGRCGRRARASRMQLPHFESQTPIFMPVGTQGTIKGLLSQQVSACEPFVILGNTYHLGQRPGAEAMGALGGLHELMNWDRALLTDSGGFQMVSLLELSKVSEEGVNFTSPHDGTQMMLTPEESMRIQNAIGADIMMVLDDVVPSTTVGDRVVEAMHRTIRWADRCKQAHKRPTEQNLFAIVQGGLNNDMRKECARELVKLGFPGYAIGGLAGGESKDDFWKAVAAGTEELPINQPRYCMGVGYPVDLVVCVALGVDMFDCVYPTRTARFGTALTSFGTLNLRHASQAAEFIPIDSECDCSVCKRYTRAFLHTIAGRDDVGCQLVSIHNIAYLMTLMKNMRTALIEGSFQTFINTFFKKYYPNRDYPRWCVDALTYAGFLLE
eukprot:ANDGO_07637.mRNA.1 putative queuine tRNA-ribosyltransferase